MSIIQTIKKNVLQLTISRKEQMNALNDETLEEMDGILQDIKHNRSIHVVVFTGDGDKAFAAGADISNFSSIANSQQALDFSRRGQHVFNEIETLPQVTIAAINGYALGGGLELALACDLRIATQNAKLGLPEIKLGLIPGYGGTQRLLRMLGYGMTKYLILSGRMVEAEKALRMGLVEEVCHPDEFESFVSRLSEELASKSPLVIQRMKEIINHGYDYDLKKGLDFEAAIFANVFTSEDAKEGISAFLEKRTPDFSGK